jgi:hypothetical protein
MSSFQNNMDDFDLGFQEEETIDNVSLDKKRKKPDIVLQMTKNISHPKGYLGDETESTLMNAMGEIDPLQDDLTNEEIKPKKTKFLYKSTASLTSPKGYLGDELETDILNTAGPIEKPIHPMDYYTNMKDDNMEQDKMEFDNIEKEGGKKKKRKTQKKRNAKRKKTRKSKKAKKTHTKKSRK